jgi:hypothetical protein
MGSLSNSDPDKSNQRRIEEIEGIKFDFVLQLYLQHGPFWEAVKEVRDRRNITPSYQIPPPDFNSRLAEYDDEALRLQDKFVPERFRRRFTFTFDWLGFLEACLLYHPPKWPPEVVYEFAAFGSGPFWSYPFWSYAYVIPEENPHERIKGFPGMIAPPIKEIRKPDGTTSYQIEWDDVTTTEEAEKAADIIAAIPPSPLYALGARVLFTFLDMSFLEDYFSDSR